MDPHEEVLLPEGVTFETSMQNVEEKTKSALVLAVFDEVVFNGTPGIESICDTRMVTSCYMLCIAFPLGLGAVL